MIALLLEKEQRLVGESFRQRQCQSDSNTPFPDDFSTSGVATSLRLEHVEIPAPLRPSIESTRSPLEDGSHGTRTTFRPIGITVADLDLVTAFFVGLAQRVPLGF
jgi:hypothetical protein